MITQIRLWFKTSYGALLSYAMQHPHEWVYLAPRWYDLKWKGGRYFFVCTQAELTKSKDVARILSNMRDQVASGDVQWYIYITPETKHFYPREVTVIKFRTYSELLAFKLTYL